MFILKKSRLGLILLSVLVTSTLYLQIASESVCGTTTVAFAKNKVLKINKSKNLNKKSQNHIKLNFLSSNSVAEENGKLSEKTVTEESKVEAKIQATSILLAQNISKGKCRNIEDILPELEKYVKEARKTWQVPGVSVAIIKDDRIYFINDGVKKIGYNNTVNENSIFCVMSLTKTITAVVFNQLVAEGKVSSNDLVIKHLPNFKISDEKILNKLKLKHFLTHSVGWPHFSADTAWHANFNREELLEVLSKIKFRTMPGEKFGYQNFPFGLIGLIIEKIEKKPLHLVFKERIFEPLDMQYSSCGTHPKQSFFKKIFKFFKVEKAHNPEFFATGHFNNGGEPGIVEVNEEPYVLSGMSGVNSSTADYIKFLWSILNHGTVMSGPHVGSNFLAREAWNTITAVQMPIKDVKQISNFPALRMKKDSFFYGNGLFGYLYGEGATYKKVFSHQGAGSGWRSMWGVIPEEKIGIVVLSNYGSMSTSLLPEVIVYKFLDLCMSLPEYDWNNEFYRTQLNYRKIYSERDNFYIKEPAPEKEQLIGVYENDLYGKVEVREEGKKLFVVFRGRKAKLSHVSYCLYNISPHQLLSRCGDDDSKEVYFLLDKERKVNSMKIGLFFEEDGIFKKVS